MIDLRKARKQPDEMRAALARKGAADVFDELLAADSAVREVQPRVEELRAARKVKGKPTPEQLAELERVKLELALYRFALDRLVTRGFTPVLPPVLVREEAMYGTGFFPTEEVNIYAVERDELYLVGTSEVPLAAMHGGEIFEADALPLRYAG